MSNIPQDLKFADSHEWVRRDDEVIITVGISDHAQGLLGDLVYVELPEVDTDVDKGEEAGVVESVKAASDVYSPVTGRIAQINEKLDEQPELVNTDPYGEGWLYKVEMDVPDELDSLMDASAYESSIEE